MIKMNKIISTLNKAITKAGGAVNNAILENALKSLGWHVCPPMVWQPIEAAPKDRWILAYQPHGMFAGKFYTGGHWYVCKWAAMDEFWYDKSTNVLEIQPGEEVVTTFHTCIPTHWMPLPEPPK